MMMDERFRAAVERARLMTPDDRLREGFRLYEQGHDYIVSSIRTTFPEASDEEVFRIRDIVLRRCKDWGIL
jgi:hypothetical protein